METAEERKLPFVVSLVFYMLTYYLMRELNLPGLLYILILGSAISIILAFFISLWWKISIHMLGVGGLVGAILGLTLRLDADLINILSIAILGAGLIGYARLKLYAHTPAQVYAGFLLGAGLMLGLIMGA